MEIPFRTCCDGFSHRRHISDEKQITYFLIQNGIAIPIHFKFFRVCDWTGLISSFSDTLQQIYVSFCGLYLLTAFIYTLAVHVPLGHPTRKHKLGEWPWPSAFPLVQRFLSLGVSWLWGAMVVPLMLIFKIIRWLALCSAHTCILRSADIPCP